MGLWEQIRPEFLSPDPVFEETGYRPPTKVNALNLRALGEIGGQLADSARDAYRWGRGVLTPGEPDTVAVPDQAIAGDPGSGISQKAATDLVTTSGPAAGIGIGALVGKHVGADGSWLKGAAGTFARMSRNARLAQRVNLPEVLKLRGNEQFVADLAENNPGIKYEVPQKVVGAATDAMKNAMKAGEDKTALSQLYNNVGRALYRVGKPIEKVADVLSGRAKTEIAGHTVRFAGKDILSTILGTAPTAKQMAVKSLQMVPQSGLSYLPALNLALEGRRAIKEYDMIAESMNRDSAEANNSVGLDQHLLNRVYQDRKARHLRPIPPVGLTPENWQKQFGIPTVAGWTVDEAGNWIPDTKRQ